MNGDIRNLEEQLEQQLKTALRRPAPPAGLEAKILRRAREGKQPSSWLRIAAAVLLLTGGLAGWQWREQQVRQQRAELVRQQLAVAMEITFRQLARAERQASRIGVQSIEWKESERKETNQ